MNILQSLSTRLGKHGKSKTNKAPTTFLDPKQTTPENVSNLRNSLKRSKLESTKDLKEITATIDKAEAAYDHEMFPTASSLLSQADREIIRSIRKRKKNSGSPPPPPRSKK